MSALRPAAPRVWRRHLLTGAALVLLLLAAAAAAYIVHLPRLGLPYRDHFAEGRMPEWKSYGGTWETAGAGVTNDSNEPGGKLLTGHPSVTDMAMSSDVRLTNNFGDAGLIFRVTRPEEGTNAFYGYYAAMRLPDTLILARMDYGFQPLQQVRIRQGVKPGVWYHMDIQVRGCDLSAEARDAGGLLLARTAVHDGTECQRAGSFGLRSFAAGGSWRDVRVHALLP